MQVIPKVGRLATGAHEKTQVATRDGLFAALVQPGFEPDTPCLARQPERSRRRR